MTVKEFFKSTAFKCIVTLLCILLVCGVFLTVAYGFLEVTDSERLQRAITNIYGKEVTITETYLDSDDSSVSVLSATITSAYGIEFTDDDGVTHTHVLVQSVGSGGYSGGTVTCRVSFEISDGEITGIYKLLIESNSGQTLMSTISSSSILEDITEDYTSGIYYTTDDYVASGATKTSNAVCNSVNGAVSYVETYVLGIEQEDKFADFAYTDYIDTKLTDYTVDGLNVTYTITAQGSAFQAGTFKFTIIVGSEKTITSYSVTDGSTYDYGQKIPEILSGSLFIGKGLSFFTDLYGEDMDYNNRYNHEEELVTGASQSTFLCYYAGAFATANYDLCIGGNS